MVISFHLAAIISGLISRSLGKQTLESQRNTSDIPHNIPVRPLPPNLGAVSTEDFVQCTRKVTVVRGKESDNRRNVVRLHSVQHVPEVLDEAWPRAGCSLWPHSCCHRCTSSGRYAVDHDTRPAAFDCECSGETNECCFRGRVVGLPSGTIWKISPALIIYGHLQIPFGDAVVMIRPYFCFWKIGQTALQH